MAAHSNEFPWLSYYGHYKFFEGRMRDHSKVLNLVRIQTGLYDLELVDGRKLKVFICECYAYGLAEYHESVDRLGDLDVVVISSNWCGYSMDAKFYCRNNGVGLFDVRGFMAALNFKKYWEYLTDYEREKLGGGY